MSSRRRATPAPSNFPVGLVIAILVGIIVGLGGYAFGRGVGRPSASSSFPIPTAPPAAGTPAPSLPDVARGAMTRTVTIEAVRASDEELGTGWLFDGNGDFVTNAHVVDGGLSIRIRDRAGVTHVARVLGLNRDQDIAVVRSNDGFAAAPLPTAHSLPGVSDSVITIASSRATGHTDVTVEQVSRLHVEVPVKGNPDVDPQAKASTTIYHDMINMSGAEIFPGNSGGPVLDLRGQVVGIVTLASRINNQAFAIPIGRALPIVQSFVATAG